MVINSFKTVTNHVGHWTLGLCPVWSSADVIVTQITTVVFGNIATVAASCKMLHWMQIDD